MSSDETLASVPVGYFADIPDGTHDAGQLLAHYLQLQVKNDRPAISQLDEDAHLMGTRKSTNG
ncbi:hypothetical protein ACNKHN_05590 [Shigella flexneri]